MSLKWTCVATEPAVQQFGGDCGKMHSTEAAAQECCDSFAAEFGTKQKIEVYRQPKCGERAVLEAEHPNWVFNVPHNYNSPEVWTALRQRCDFGGPLKAYRGKPFWEILNTGHGQQTLRKWLEAAEHNRPTGKRSAKLWYRRMGLAKTLLRLRDENPRALAEAIEKEQASLHQAINAIPFDDPDMPKDAPEPEPAPKGDRAAAFAKLQAALAEAMGEPDAGEVESIAKAVAQRAIADAVSDGTLVYTVEVKRPDGRYWTPPDGALHEAFESVMQFVSIGEPVLVKGPAGTGKSYLAEQIAEALGLGFTSMSLSGGTAEHHFLGSRLPNEQGCFVHRTTPFLEAFEGGGVLLLDEVDACDENVLLAINNGIANGTLVVPGRDGREVAKKHKDFRLIAAANTWGTGPSALYVGRNQLDAAFLDRFAQIAVDYDRKLELSICSDNKSLAIRWHEIRDKVASAQLRRVVSMRGLIRAQRMTMAHGWTIPQCVTQLTASWTDDERKTVGV